MQLYCQASGEYLIQGIEPGMHNLFFAEALSDQSFNSLCAAIEKECRHFGLTIMEASLATTSNQTRSTVSLCIATREE